MAQYNGFGKVNDSDSRIFNAAKNYLLKNKVEIVASKNTYVPIGNDKSRQVTSAGAIIVKGVSLDNLVKNHQFPGTPLKSDSKYIILARNKITKNHPSKYGKPIDGEERLIIGTE